MSLLLPPKVAQEIQKEKWVEQRGRFRAKLEALLDFDDPVCRRWNPHLRELDPLLRMGRAHPLAYERGWTVRPGFYHWVRDNPTTAPTVTPITNDGEWCEPDSGVLEKLRRFDLQDPRIFALLLEQQELVEKQAERQEAEHDEERQEEILERWMAGTRVGVSMNRDTPWTQNASGRRSTK